jgi:hypothetical protein
MSGQRSRSADVQSSAYHFFGAAFSMLGQMDRGILKNWTKTEREALYDPYRESYERLNGKLAKAEKEVNDRFLVVDQLHHRKMLSAGGVAVFRPGSAISDHSRVPIFESSVIV